MVIDIYILLMLVFSIKRGIYSQSPLLWHPVPKKQREHRTLFELLNNLAHFWFQFLFLSRGYEKQFVSFKHHLADGNVNFHTLSHIFLLKKKEAGEDYKN